MNSKHRKTIQAVRRVPASASILWDDIESLFVAIGCEVVEGPGSAVSFKKDGEVEFFHRPHPQKEAQRYQVRAAKRFLERLEVEL